MSEVLLEVKNLKKHFVPHLTLAQTLSGGKKRVIKAVDGVSFSIMKGEIFGLIGESGSGKTTTGKLIMKLIEPTSGTITFDGEDVTFTNKAKTQEYRRKVQMIFQDPYASMNPRFKIRDVLLEPLIIHKMHGNRAEQIERVLKALTEVKLTPPEEVSIFLLTF